MWDNLKRQFSSATPGGRFVWIILLVCFSAIGLIDGILAAWGDERPVGTFAEVALATVLAATVFWIVPFVAGAFGVAAYETWNSRPIAWTVGLTAFLLIVLMLYGAAESIPGVGWRFRSMTNL